MKLLPIKSLKFGNAVMISGSQESSVTVIENSISPVTISLDLDRDIYLVERKGTLTLIHATNVQYALPMGLKSVGDYEALSLDLAPGVQTSMKSKTKA